MTLNATAVQERRRRTYVVKDAVGARIGVAALRMVPVTELRLDPAYQRDISQPWISEHLPFNTDKCGAIIVSARGGGLFVIDGQHRWRLAEASGVTVIAAVVIEGLTKKQEAEAFRNYQMDRRSLTAWALWRADLVAELPEANAIQAAVLRAGFKVRKSREDDRVILTIDALRRTYRLAGGRTDPLAGEQLIEDTLRLIGDYWLGEDMALSAPVIYGLALFLSSARTRPEWNEKYVRSAMTKTAPTKMSRYAQALAAKRKAVGAAPSDFAQAIVDQYDKAAPDDHKLRDLKLARIAGSSR